MDTMGTSTDSLTAPTNELDPGITEVVALLQGWDFETTDSGDGVTKLRAGWSPDEALDIPHVHMQVRPDLMVQKADLLRGLLRCHNIPVESQRPGGIYIQASYDPMHDSAILSLYGLNNELLEMHWRNECIESPAAGRGNEAPTPDGAPRAADQNDLTPSREEYAAYKREKILRAQAETKVRALEEEIARLKAARLTDLWQQDEALKRAEQQRDEAIRRAAALREQLFQHPDVLEAIAGHCAKEHGLRDSAEAVRECRYCSQLVFIMLSTLAALEGRA